MIIKASVLACKQHSSAAQSPPTFDSNMFACGTPLLMTLHVHIYKKYTYHYSVYIILSLFVSRMYMHPFSFLSSEFYFLLCVSLVFHRHCPLPVHVFAVFVSFHFSPHCFRYFFPPLDLPRAGTRYGHLLPPSSLIEHCDAEPIQPQQQPLPHRHSSRALLPLPEAEGQWYGDVLAEIRGDMFGGWAWATQLPFIFNKDCWFLFAVLYCYFSCAWIRRGTGRCHEDFVKLFWEPLCLCQSNNW